MVATIQLFCPTRYNFQPSFLRRCYKVPFPGGKYILYGNMQGVYWSELGRNTMPVHVLSLPDVSQIDVLENYNLLVCLSGTLIPRAVIRHLYLILEQHTESQPSLLIC